MNVYIDLYCNLRDADKTVGKNNLGNSFAVMCGIDDHRGIFRHGGV